MEIKNLIESKKAQKSIFWEALILSVFIFASGIFLGYLLEKNRTSKIISLYQESELSLLDVQIQDDLFSSDKLDCSLATQEIIIFADRVYNEAKLLDRYESASDLSKSLVLEHKKYDLLRVILWNNVLKIEEGCDNNFDTVVYFYEYESENLDVRSEQNVFSKKLAEIKEQKGNSMILIPIAGNLNITSINYLANFYNITRLPAILINEKDRVESLDDLDKLENYLK